jgi:hypothetical protein
MWWVPQVVGLGGALVGSAVGWLIAALPLGLWATQGCLGGDPAYGTACPSGHYVRLAMWLYAVPALLWACCWLFPQRIRWRPARIIVIVAAVMIVTAIPLIGAYLAFDHMHIFRGT